MDDDRESGALGDRVCGRTIRMACGEEAPAGHLVAVYEGEVICAEEHARG